MEYKREFFIKTPHGGKDDAADEGSGDTERADLMMTFITYVPNTDIEMGQDDVEASPYVAEELRQFTTPQHTLPIQSRALSAQKQSSSLLKRIRAGRLRGVERKGEKPDAVILETDDIETPDCCYL